MLVVANNKEETLALGLEFLMGIRTIQVSKCFVPPSHPLDSILSAHCFVNPQVLDIVIILRKIGIKMCLSNLIRPPSFIKSTNVSLKILYQFFYWALHILLLAVWNDFLKAVCSTWYISRRWSQPYRPLITSVDNWSTSSIHHTGSIFSTQEWCDKTLCLSINCFLY